MLGKKYFVGYQGYRMWRETGMKLLKLTCFKGQTNIIRETRQPNQTIRDPILLNYIGIV